MQLEHGGDYCTCRPCPKGRDDMFWRQDEELACEQRYELIKDKICKACKGKKGHWDETRTFRDCKVCRGSGIRKTL